MGLQGSTVAAPHTFRGGDHLVSPNGHYSAVMQDDGDFVIYWGRWPDRLIGAMWSTETTRTSEEWFHTNADLAADGGFAVGAGLSPPWSTKGPGGPGPFYAAMQDDGCFVLVTGTVSSPGKTYFTTGTNVGTIWVHNSAWLVVSASVTGGTDTGNFDLGKCRAATFGRESRTATAEFRVAPNPSGELYASFDLGAERAQRYRFDESRVVAVKGHGKF